MSLYARSDLMSVSIPQASGGCGKTHSRPVSHGAPAKTWKLDCNPCEANLRGDGKAKIIKVIPGDKDQGIPSRMEHVPDSDPHWSSTPEGIPPTPDEQHINKIRAERGSAQLQQLSALAALQGAGLKIPDEAMWLLSQNFDARIVKGTVVCANGHDNVSGAKFCAECGIDMATRGSLPPASTEEGSINPLPLGTLHVSSLKKMCRDRGVSDKGTKAQLIERLTSLQESHEQSSRPVQTLRWPQKGACCQDGCSCRAVRQMQ